MYIDGVHNLVSSHMYANFLSFKYNYASYCTFSDKGEDNATGF